MSCFSHTIIPLLSFIAEKFLFNFILCSTILESKRTRKWKRLNAWTYDIIFCMWIMCARSPVHTYNLTVPEHPCPLRHVRPLTHARTQWSVWRAPLITNTTFHKNTLTDYNNTVPRCMCDVCFVNNNIYSKTYIRRISISRKGWLLLFLVFSFHLFHIVQGFSNELYERCNYIQYSTWHE